MAERLDATIAGAAIAGAAGITADPAAADWGVMIACAVAGGYAAVAFRESALSAVDSVRIVIACACVAVPCAWTSAVYAAGHLDQLAGLSINSLSGTTACLIAFLADQAPAAKRKAVALLGKVKP